MKVAKAEYEVEVQMHESGNWSATIKTPDGEFPHVIVEESRQAVLDKARSWVRWHREKPEPEVFYL